MSGSDPFDSLDPEDERDTTIDDTLDSGGSDTDIGDINPEDLGSDDGDPWVTDGADPAGNPDPSSSGTPPGGSNPGPGGGKTWREYREEIADFRENDSPWGPWNNGKQKWGEVVPDRIGEASKMAGTILSTIGASVNSKTGGDYALKDWASLDQRMTEDLEEDDDVGYEVIMARAAEDAGYDIAEVSPTEIYMDVATDEIPGDVDESKANDMLRGVYVHPEDGIVSSSRSTEREVKYVNIDEPGTLGKLRGIPKHAMENSALSFLPEARRKYSDAHRATRVDDPGTRGRSRRRFLADAAGLFAASQLIGGDGSSQEPDSPGTGDESPTPTPTATPSPTETTQSGAGQDGTPTETVTETETRTPTETQTETPTETTTATPEELNYSVEDLQYESIKAGLSDQPADALMAFEDAIARAYHNRDEDIEETAEDAFVGVDDATVEEYLAANESAQEGFEVYLGFEGGNEGIDLRGPASAGVDAEFEEYMVGLEYTGELDEEIEEYIEEVSS